MKTLLYALTFPPMVPIALIVQEAGDTEMARTLRVRVMRFYVGIELRMITRYTGRRTRVSLPDGNRPTRTGQIIHYRAAPPEPEDATDQRAVLWQPALMAIKNRRRTAPIEGEQEIIQEATLFNRSHAGFTGKVKEMGTARSSPQTPDGPWHGYR